MPQGAEGEGWHTQMSAGACRSTQAVGLHLTWCGNTPQCSRCVQDSAGVHDNSCRSSGVARRCSLRSCSLYSAGWGCDVEQARGGAAAGRWCTPN